MPSITRLDTAAKRSWLNSAAVMLGIPCRMMYVTADSHPGCCSGRRHVSTPAAVSGGQVSPHWAA